ncbi:MAG: CBS domain-containing protein [Gammaproteobacteria bacterium]|nr:CBS domain-containing protein [Gammaproteobacteria bacterium]
MSQLAVQALIKRPPYTIGLDTTLEEMVTILEAQKFHHLLVVDYDRLVGIVSDRDILKRLSPWIGTVRETDKDTATQKIRAHQMMTRNLITVAPEWSVFEAIELMLEKRVSILPVVDDAQRPVGVISWRDVLTQIMTHRAQQMAQPAR